jgi:hypothetical protein
VSPSRRWCLLAILAAGLSLAGVTIGCAGVANSANRARASGATSASTDGASEGPRSTSYRESPTSPPTRTAAATGVSRRAITRHRLRSLPVPAPITPLVSPPLPEEGAWQPAGDKLANGYAVYTTYVRPSGGLPQAGIAWIDSAATRLVLYAGTAEPYGAWPQQGAVESAQQPALLAAFNSGFKIYAYRTGWYDAGQTAMPLQTGAASLVIFDNGTATVAEWGRDVALAPGITAVRQNLVLLVDHGAPNPDVADPSLWGAVLGGGVPTWRSGVGVTATGNLVYAAGPDLSPSLLANLLVAAGAQRAMELDINPEWVSFASFTRTPGVGQSGLSGNNLLSGMYFSPGHYLQPYSRDFFAVLAR